MKNPLKHAFTHQPVSVVYFNSLINRIVQCIVNFNKKHERWNLPVFKHVVHPSNKLLYTATNSINSSSDVGVFN